MPSRSPFHAFCISAGSMVSVVAGAFAGALSWASTPPTNGSRQRKSRCGKARIGVIVVSLRFRGHRADEGLELWAHRQIDAGAAGQAPEEPALVLALHLALLRQPAERLDHDARQLGIP